MYAYNNSEIRKPINIYIIMTLWYCDNRDHSVKFSHSVMSDFLRPHGLQHARLPCPSSTPRAYSNSCPLSWWHHLTILSCRPLILPPSIFPSNRVFSNESILHSKWPKYWSFNFNISPSNEYSGLISFISNILEEISSLSHSVVFLYFFALIAEEGVFFLLFFGTLHSYAYIFPFLLCFSLLFFSKLFVRPPQTAILLFCISFPWDGLDHCLLYNVTKLLP